MAKIVVGFGILCGLILLFKFFLFRQLVKSLKSDRSNNFFQFLLSRFFEKQQKPNFSYKSRGYLCTQAEKKFFDVLAKAVGETYFICPKVRIADVIEVESKYFRSSKSGGFNKISQKHLDFVICDAGSMAIIGVVELDDRSHLRSDRMARDEFVDRALETAGIPIFHQPTRGKYSLETLKSELAATLGLQFEETKDNGFDIDTDEPPKNRDKRVSVLLEKTVAPCPDCGGKLDKKKIVRGVHAGKIVLACRNQPKCRYLVPYRHQPEGSSIPSEPEVSVSADDVDEELERREPRLN